MKKVLLFFICVLMVFSLCSCSSKKTQAVITVENYGEITLELDSKEAPITVANFVKLSKSGFYDGLTFHRVVNNFMVQAGDPLGNSLGGSSETIKGEFKANKVENNIPHVRGTISMARSSLSYDSASSQFFICQVDCRESLDGIYAAFGKVTKGIEIIDKICEDAKGGDENGILPKENQPVITSIKIL